MSLPPNSAQLMASRRGNGGRNGHSKSETFHRFFECWLTEQNQKLQELISASEDHRRHQTDGNESANVTGEGIVVDAAAALANGDHHQQLELHEEMEEAGDDSDADDDDRELRQLINGVIEHYELYYKAKSQWAIQDVLSMLTPPWKSTLEDAFLWIGGWRPSMAFHLLYSKAGLQLVELIRGPPTGDLADLSAGQLRQIDELQGNTIFEERKITETMAKHQETVADASTVELSHVITEMIHTNGHSNNDRGMQERVDSMLAPKEEGLEEILAKADDLRQRTLKAILEILNPIQAIHFLIAAAELHLRIHDWGKIRDTGQSHITNGHSL